MFVQPAGDQRRACQGKTAQIRHFVGLRHFFEKG
ncbi:hypothetical protein PMI02_04131, partial [Novosphingobium sp. AP12]